MAVFRHESIVDAPLDAVWDFQARPSHLESVTPAFVNVEVTAVRGPDGEAVDPDDVLREGAAVDVRTRPFGLWESAWTSTIVDLERSPDAARFRDRMQDGPFARWDHVHRFESTSDGRTVLVDRVDYRLDEGIPGRALDPFARVGFEPVFRYRHRATRRTLE